MDRRGDARPPRSARPGQHTSQNQSRSPAPSYPEQAHPTRSHAAPTFQQADRQGDPTRQQQRSMPSAYRHQQLPSSDPTDPETGEYDPAIVGRKKSLVRPDREKIEPGHRQWHYRSRVTQLEEEGPGRVGVLPSSTGNAPHGGLRRGKSLLAREQDQHESGLALFKLRKRGSHGQAASGGGTKDAPLPPQPNSSDPNAKASKKGRVCMGDTPGPGGPWMTYCFILTCWIPPVLMRSCGLRSPEQQRAWREKMGLVGIILFLMAGVGFLTFGFTEAVCGTPPDRFHGGHVGDGFIGNTSVVIHGYDYDFSKFNHPPAGDTFNGTSNPLLVGDWDLGGNDASFLFQKTNLNCLGIMKKAAGSTITGNADRMDWYFPCNVFGQEGKTAVNLTNYETNFSCHNNAQAINGFLAMKAQGQVYYTWDDVNNNKRNLAVYESTVLDLSLLSWLNRAQVNYPAVFDEMAKGNGTFSNKDITMYISRTKQQNVGHCLQDLVTIGFIDTNSIGCVASEVVLYLSLVFIIGVVAIRFVMAIMFQWFFSWKLGNFPRETYEQRMQRSSEIEAWSNNIYSAGPAHLRPTVQKGGFKWGRDKRKTFLPDRSRFTPSDGLLKGAGSGRPNTTYGMLDSSASGYKRSTVYAAGKGTPPDSPGYRQSKYTVYSGGDSAAASRTGFTDTTCPFPLINVVPQPPPDYEPFNFPLAHTICLVTAYSESFEGLRTTMDSLATTDYPNSHKLILVIADGMVKGAGNDLTTPEICLTMMKDLVIASAEVEPHSYVAIADGHKRHNMAKVYAGFYDYDDATVEVSKQQRIPVVLVAKCGNPREANEAKPGNRGKRDSQIVLMAFLQKVLFDERMTTFEYEFFNSIWRVTGVSPDRYELVLCVDADTKVFPDSLTRMVSCMVCDEEIMGLCGETKIANKADSFVTMMQVFEYYISHHMTKAFESMFGGVTCLPGCFSMYRIKARKGEKGYWVPILANPDIIEHYSENVVDTLHKKNLLLLGEDRYLTTLMLKTFPKRKNMFCPQAVCKTIVPDTFGILLSQRRRWINSTIHNLAELLLVRDLCGTFCFSMQFVVGMELAGTLVLPAAITFTVFLIVSSAVPGGPDTTIPLILLAIVLGLPGILIVVTSRKVAYIWWMLVYLLSLPIWNGILPAYAFWHFDDFSWGQTRKVAGDTGADHGDKDGEFDSSDIVMKRWVEFERDRRHQQQQQVRGRDSQYLGVGDKRSNRQSTASNSDFTHQPSFAADSSTVESAQNPAANGRSRHDSNQYLVLPAPLAVSPNNRALTASSSRNSEDNYADNGSQRHLVTPQSVEYYGQDRTDSPTSGSRLMSRGYPDPARDPFRTTSPATSGYDDNTAPYTPDMSDESGYRGVRLADNGPAGASDGVRRVARQTGRRTSQTMSPQSQQQQQQQAYSPYGSSVPQQQHQQQQQNRYSRPSSYALPPGAAPPQAGTNNGGYGY